MKKKRERNYYFGIMAKCKSSVGRERLKENTHFAASNVASGAGKILPTGEEGGCKESLVLRPPMTLETELR